MHRTEGLYFDGKKCNTLVRDTKCVNIQVDYISFYMKLTPTKGAQGAWQEFPCSGRNNWDKGLLKY